MATIVCADDLSRTILSCQSCQEREERNRLRRSSRPMNQQTRNLMASQEGTSILASTSMPIRRQNRMVSPLEFVGDELLLIQNSGADLSFRITCYCRHHDSSGFRYKSSFPAVNPILNSISVRFTLTDYLGRTVGEVMTDPIIIIDNHKVKPKLPRPRPPRRQRKVNGPVPMSPIHGPL